MSEGLLLFLGGALVTALGFFVKRRLERHGIHEELDRRQKVLSIRKAMQEQGVSAVELDSFELFLLGKAPGSAMSGREAGNVVADAAAALEGHDLSQADLNRRAHERWLLADQELQAAVREWRSRLGPGRQRLLDQTQGAWEVFRDAQASLAASNVEGGSLAPLIYALMRDALTRKRTLELPTLEKADDLEAPP